MAASTKQLAATQKARDEQEISRDDLPALLIVPDGLEIPPWNNDRRGNEDDESLRSIDTPFCCFQLPSGASLFSANLAVLRRAKVQEVFVLARSNLIKTVESHLQDKCW